MTRAIQRTMSSGGPRLAGPRIAGEVGGGLGGGLIVLLALSGAEEARTAQR